MAYYVGLDASKERASVCIIDESGAIVEEAEVASDPKAIAGFLRGGGRRYRRVGMESWSLAPWLYVGLAKARLPIICIEARHAHAMLKAARKNKTDRNDARGIAELMRLGSYKTVHVKSPQSRRTRALLTVRRLLITKRRDIENAIGAALLAFGLKLRTSGGKGYEGRIHALTKGDPFVAGLIEPLLAVRRQILAELAVLEDRLRTLAHQDPVCQLLMTAPGVGPLVALTFRMAVDEPARFPRSRDVAAHFGLTPRSRQSGTQDFKGPISRAGDKEVRSALFTAAQCQLRRNTRSSWLKTWARQVAHRRGSMKAIVAVARRLAVVLHRMWITRTEFRWEVAPA